jgi:hypothetical protein
VVNERGSNPGEQGSFVPSEEGPLKNGEKDPFKNGEDGLKVSFMKGDRGASSPRELKEGGWLE